jgi:TRAP-type C4-dicarboxylate transport system permease small subunit
LAWRTWLGGLNAYVTQSSTMMMGVPEWYVYAAMVPAFVLTALIALMQALRGFETEVQA